MANRKAEKDLEERIKILRGIASAAVQRSQLAVSLNATKELGRVQAELHRRRESRLSDRESDPIKRIARKRLLAEGDGSWVAVARMLNDENELKKAEDLKEELQILPEAMTPEEWAIQIDEDAAAASDTDLEAYVAEWARRLGLEFDGSTAPPTLRRAGLRLIGDP